ncbi:hypothetical protein Nepgr_023391 [Nepenthes gracilis]|uniref:Protein kinase domain-containing protein n=1 Tax=Nepenthes gracilis TaxID=150966 RepID=A0AAD3T2R3_NEPGR|nr:hypothetical protein Nepgr_023391 [Nepenthes gracilis]
MTIQYDGKEDQDGSYREQTCRSTSAAAFYVVEADVRSSHEACAEHQIVIWFIIPATRNPQTDHNNNALALIDLLQYVPRLYQIFPLNSQIVQTTGVITKIAWAGAAHNLLLYMLAGHVLGAAWSIARLPKSQEFNWKSAIVGLIQIFSFWGSVGQLPMQFLSRYIFATQTQLNCNDQKEDESSDPDHESGAIIPVSNETLSHHIPPLTNSRCLPIELEGLHEHYLSTCRVFKYQELQLATSTFSSGNLIGKGSSSRVYQWCLSDCNELAVKILKHSEEMLKKFILEIEIISSLHHKNIMSLLGFCFEGDNLLLVCDFLPRGSLAENLHGCKDPRAFSWNERYKLADSGLASWAPSAAFFLLNLHPLIIPVGRLVLSPNLGSLQAKNNTTVTGDLYSWPLMEDRINMDVCNNGSFIIASYSDLSTSKEDVVYASRLRSCGLPLIRKAIMRERHDGNGGEEDKEEGNLRNRGLATGERDDSNGGEEDKEEGNLQCFFQSFGKI